MLIFQCFNMCVICIVSYEEIVYLTQTTGILLTSYFGKVIGAGTNIHHNCFMDHEQRFVAKRNFRHYLILNQNLHTRLMEKYLRKFKYIPENQCIRRNALSLSHRFHFAGVSYCVLGQHFSFGMSLSMCARDQKREVTVELTVNESS